jgi:hypothetical protein
MATKATEGIRLRANIVLQPTVALNQAWGRIFSQNRLAFPKVDARRSLRQSIGSTSKVANTGLE